MKTLTYNGNRLTFNGGYITSKPFVPSLLKDLDGNTYTSVVIGDQEWIVENFRCTKYADNTNIPNITDDGDWSLDNSGAYCAYNNDSNLIDTFGLLYNWHAVTNEKELAYLEKNGVQETGWKIPSNQDFNDLVTFLGGDSIAGGKLKSSGTEYWDYDLGTNNFGFTSLPSGIRYNSGSFDSGYDAFSKTSYYWSNNEYDITFAYWLYMSDGDNSTFQDYSYKTEGMSVRLIKNI